MSQGKALEVINKEQKSVNMNNFFKEMSNPDEDYAVLALNSLQEILEEHHVINVSTGGEKMFINKFVDKMKSSHLFVPNAVFKVISLLIKYFKVSFVPYILETMIETALNEPGIKQQILTIIKDNIASCPTFEEERVDIIFQTLFTDQKNKLAVLIDDDLVFLLELFSSIYQNIGYRASKEDNKFIIDKVLWLFEQNAKNATVMSPLIYLLQSWCQFATEDMIEQVFQFIKKDTIKDTNIPLDIIYSLATKVTKLLKPYLDDIIPFLIGVVDNVSEFLQENEATDGVVFKCANAILALGRIVDYYPETCLEKQDELFGVAFGLLSYDCDTILNTEKHEEEEEEEEELSNEDMEFIDEFDNAVSHSATWRIRKSSIALCNNLFNEYPEEFFSYFYGNYQDFNTIIQDSDIGVQNDAFEILTKIFNKYKSEIPEEISDLFAKTICNNVNCEQKSIAASLSTLIAIIKINGSINEEYALKALRNLSTNITTTAANQVFRLLQEIIKTKPSEAIIDSTCNLLVNTSSLPSSYIVTVIEVSLNVYTATKKATESIIKLNKFVIESTKASPECLAAALSTVAVFLVLYNGAETSNESVELIKDSLGKPTVRKALLGALVIISSTKDTCKILEPLAEQIVEALITALESNDSSVQFRCLWAVKLMLEGNILNQNLVKQILLKVVNLIASGDNRSCALALEIINENNNPDVVKQAQLKLKEALNNHVEKDFVDAAVKFVKANISKQLIDELIEVGEQEIKQGERGEKAALTTADVIGYSIAGTELEGSIKLAESIFTTLVAGALGSISDISKNQELVDKIFNIATTYDDRAAFTAASEAVGRIAVGSQSILNRLIIISDKEDQHIPTWIIAFNALAYAAHGKLTAKQLAPIVKYLLECRGGPQNTKSCADALSYIAQADNAFIAEYFKKGTAISIYAVDLLASRSEEALVATLIKSAIELVDTKKPDVSSYAISILIHALKFPALVSQVAAGAEKIISCTKFDKDAHIVVEDIGFGKTEIDIGKQLRVNAITAITLLDKNLPISEIIDAAIAALYDPAPEVIAKDLSLLSRLPLIDLETFISKEDKAVEGLLEIEKSIKKPEFQLVEVPFISALGSLASSGLGSARFLELISRYSSDENYQKALKERIQTEAIETESCLSVLANFVAQYNKEAFIIFNELNKNK
jgi:hypothetical protein